MRIVRFSGAAEVFWPVGMHSLLVADLMPPAPNNPWLEVHALLHDAAEVCVADVPRPMKTAEARAIEDRVTARIYAALGVPEPSDAIKAAVKEADFRAALAEGTCGCAGRGYSETQTGFRLDEQACRLLNNYLVSYSPDEALKANGHWPLEYERRLRKALRAAQHGVSYAPDTEVAIDAAIDDLYRSPEHRPSREEVQ